MATISSASTSFFKLTILLKTFSSTVSSGISNCETNNLVISEVRLFAAHSIILVFKSLDTVLYSSFIESQALFHVSLSASNCFASFFAFSIAICTSSNSFLFSDTKLSISCFFCSIACSPSFSNSACLSLNF